MPEAAAWLRERSVDPVEDGRVRCAALALRADRRDPETLGDAIALLAAPSWPLVKSAVEALRTLHAPEAIPPLIETLRREDLGALRSDVHAALRSLTGETHGPYAEPWAAWWAAERAAFEMPRRPLPASVIFAPPTGVTFYGITTFSRRVCFAIDASGSMAEVDAAARGRDGAETKLAVARREALAALDVLDDGSRFAVLLFRRGIESLPGGVLRADAGTRAQARRFLAAAEPDDVTNLHDALAEAFALAGATGPVLGTEPPIDTVYLLTDGHPSSGPVTDPEGILAAVRAWHRAVPLVVHCVGVGDHDADLLRGIAHSHRRPLREALTPPARVASADAGRRDDGIGGRRQGLGGRRGRRVGGPGGGGGGRRPARAVAAREPAVPAPRAHVERLLLGVGQRAALEPLRVRDEDVAHEGLLVGGHVVEQRDDRREGARVADALERGRGRDADRRVLVLEQEHEEVDRLRLAQRAHGLRRVEADVRVAVADEADEPGHGLARSCGSRRGGRPSRARGRRSRARATRSGGPR